MEKITFAATSYRGYASEILRLRNNNRVNHQKLDYIEWRYMGEECPYPPGIFWVYLSDMHVGMAAIVFRPYWVDGKLHYFAVLGDISLNEEMRGKGIGKKFLHFVSLQIETQSYYCSFVIPNAAVKKSLDSCGWAVPESFAWYILFVDPVSKIYDLFKTRVIADLLSKIYRFIIKMRLSLISIEQYRIEKVKTFDESFDFLWQAYPKTGIIIRDRSTASLRWRYEKHPNVKYDAIKFIREDKFIGYIVYSLQKDGCFIEDILILETKFIKPIIKLFINEIRKNKNVAIIRAKLNINHPYAAKLDEIGFIKRIEKDVFQTFTPDKKAFAPDCKWFVTRADKDT